MGQRSRKWFTKLGLDMWGFKKLRKYTVRRGAGFSQLPREITNIQERRLNRRLGGDRIGSGVERGKRGKGVGRKDRQIRRVRVLFNFQTLLMTL